ncbi:DgyrCDS9047 [Dimorphilus gyrociliatus]|uniref:DgyrCDS9047 n=1 Tax=Dimorphilus gyrociliatus TaxID=2664684 RepID=A0A7I8VVY1_9ANNE|nr:DgyrCDS9047 [Dimorphilus gyrociliatus]
MEDELPSYEKAVKTAVLLLNRIDIDPLIRSGDNIICMNFRELTEKANLWLSKHRNCRVINCETLSTPYIKNKTQSQNSHFIPCEENILDIDGEYLPKCHYCLLKRLRVYIRSKTIYDSDELDEIDFINFHINYSNYEMLDNDNTFYNIWTGILQSLNQYLNENSLPGTIINIQLQFINKDKMNDLNCSRFYEYSKDSNNSSVIFLRIFYIKGNINHQKLYAEDFIPQFIGNKQSKKKPKYENMTSVMGRIQKWIFNRPNIHITNIQTLCVELLKDFPQTLGSYKSDYHFSTSLRILRVYYTIKTPSLSIYPIKLTFKCFFPGIVRPDSSETPRICESLDKLWYREVIPFVNYNSHVKIINVETIALEENSNTHIMSDDNCKRKVLHVRVYFDGPVADPPPGFLMPPPSYSSSDYHKSQSCQIL